MKKYVFFFGDIVEILRTRTFGDNVAKGDRAQITNRAVTGYANVYEYRLIMLNGKREGRDYGFTWRPGEEEDPIKLVDSVYEERRQVLDILTQLKKDMMEPDSWDHTKKENWEAMAASIEEITFFVKKDLDKSA